MARIRYVSPGVAAVIAVTGTKIGVITKATDSEFWQSMPAGSKKAGGDFGVRLVLSGPTSEADIDGQVKLVENSISRGAEAIVLASDSSTALNGVVKRARAAGIKVITVDNAITEQTEGFIGTDNIKAGQRAGERMCKLIKDMGKADGKIIHESSVSGQQVLVDRFTGFGEGLAKDCPKAEIVQTLVNDNDGLWHGPRARRRGPGPGPGPLPGLGALPGRRERRGQVHTDQDPDRCRTT
jgi:ribose transport system substrate-binding protein